MTLFMTQKKREEIGDKIDELQMKQYHKRCKIEDAKESGNEKLVAHEERRIEEIDDEIYKLKKKLK